jgi:hypothetical protein
MRALISISRLVCLCTMAISRRMNEASYEYMGSSAAAVTADTKIAICAGVRGAGNDYAGQDLALCDFRSASAAEARPDPLAR